MNQDPLDQQIARLFAAGREESPSEEVQRRVAGALRSRVVHTKKRPSRGQRMSAFALAAFSLSAFFLFFTRTTREAVDISAESAVVRSPVPESQEKKVFGPKEAGQEMPSEKPSDLLLPSSKPRAVPDVPVKRAPPTLDEELAAMHAARTALGSGNATSALAELDRFENLRGFRKLSVEASLLRIESLERLGKLEEARTRAVRFIAENPDNPLVDRAAQFTRSSSPEDAEKLQKSESE